MPSTGEICGVDFDGSWVSDGDLHPCVQSFLNDLPPLLILLVGGVRVIRTWRRQVQIDWREIQPRLAFVCSALLSLIAAIALGKFAAGDPRLPYQLLQSALCAVGWFVATSLLCMERRRILVLHWSLRIFWVLDGLTLLKSLESAISSLARGHPLDDTQLINFVRAPLEAVLVYFAIVWRKKGYDEDAYHIQTAEDEAQLQSGGVLHVGPHTSYLIDEEYGHGLDGSGRGEHASGFSPASPTEVKPSAWSRFLQFAGASDDRDEAHGPHPSTHPRNMSVGMDGIHHIDSGSFVRQPSVLPRDSPGSPASASRSNPFGHPLFSCQLSLASYSDQVVHNRRVVSFLLKIRVRADAYASGDATVDTVEASKKFAEFEGLADMLAQTRDKYGVSSLPILPAAPRAQTNLDLTRKSLEIWLQQVMVDPTYWEDVAAFVGLYPRLAVMRQHKQAVLQATIAAATTLLPNQTSSAAPSESTSPPPMAAALSSTPTVKSRVPGQASQRGGGAGFDYTLIGVSVPAWMKWQVNKQAGADGGAGGGARRDSTSGGESEVAGERAKDATATAAVETYVTFQVRVRTSRGEWNAHKRLGELQALRVDLAKRFPAFPIPQLNVDKSTYDRDEGTLAQARRDVEIFLQSVVGTSYFECAELHACLQEQDHHTKRVTKDKLIACSDPTMVGQATTTTTASDALGSSSTPTATMLAPIASQARSILSPGPQLGTPRGAGKLKGDRSVPGSYIPTRSSSSSVAKSSSLHTFGTSLTMAEESYFGGAAGANFQPPDGAASTSPRDGASSSTRSPPLDRPSGPMAIGSVTRHSYSQQSGLMQHNAISMAGSYLDNADGDGEFSANVSDTDEDDDDEYVDQSSSTGGMTAGVLPSAASSGQLPQYKTEVKRPDGNHRFTVVITSWAFVSETPTTTSGADGSGTGDDSVPKKPKSGGKKHVSFRIVIREFFSVSSYLEWSVSRRYAQFDQLHTSLKKLFPQLSLPALPPKTLVAKPTMQFLDQRKQMLEIYLQQLINTTTYQVDEFFSFFDLNKPNRQITMGNLNQVPADAEAHM